MGKNFAHLHVHSEGSLLDGLCRHENLFEAVKEKGMDTIAITEHGAFYFIPEAYEKAKEAGIKLIPGYEAYIVEDISQKNPHETKYHLTLLAKNTEGYKNLLKLASKASSEGFYSKPRIDFEILKQHAEGLICLSGCMQGKVPALLTKNDFEKSKQTALKYKELFGSDYYLEIQNHFLDEDKKIIEGSTKLSRELDIPLVATNDVHYIEKEDAKIHDILLCIQTGKSIEDNDRLKFPNNEFYLKTPKEMQNLFSDIPEALENTVKIAEKCEEVEIEFGGHHYPNYKPPKNLSPEEYLKKLTLAGLKKRYGKENVTKEMVKQVEHELKVINDKEVASYFLIVWDFIKAAKEKGILVGPGRGSAAGSMVSYCLGITNIDPLRYKLVFERFLNPERVAMPDIDLDFDDKRRHEIFRYIIEKYGEEKVAQITTFGTMGAKAAVRDVGRALGKTKISQREIDEIAKAIPQGEVIEDALKSSLLLQNKYSNNETVRFLLDAAMQLEGMPRHASVHAAAAVIADKPVTEYVPTRLAEGRPVTQIEMGTCEKLGLLKMDLLGLKTLTVINETLNLVNQKEGKSLKADDIPVDDPEIYKLFSEGKTAGIFQIESPGIVHYCKELEPKGIDDIIALAALYRPGPLGYEETINGEKLNMVDLYIKRKHGELPVEYPHKDLAEILGDTYGIILYQEQVQQIARKMAGYSLGQADQLRRAMGKKKPELIEEHREYFLHGSKEKGIEGAVNKGYSEKLANQVYDMMAKFAGYGFNRAHSACYGYIAAQTAWLKTYYPLEFAAATMSVYIENTDKLKYYLFKFRSELPIAPPNINQSSALFSVKNEEVVFGLNGIANIGQELAKTIAAERQDNGQYSDMLDLCKRVKMSSKAIESLISAGALDCFPGNRAQKLALIEQVNKIAEEERQSKNQLNLFGETTMEDIKLPDIPEDSGYLAKEHKMLGMYLSDNPLQAYEKIFDQLGVDIVETNEEQEFEGFSSMQQKTYGGIITEVTPPTGKTAQIKAEDIMGTTFTIYVRADNFTKYESTLQPHRVITVTGKSSGSRIFADTIINIEKIINGITITVNENEENTFKKIKNICEQCPGNLPVLVKFPNFDKQTKLNVNVNLKLGLKLNEQDIPFKVNFKQAN